MRTLALAAFVAAAGCSSTGPFDASPEDADATATIDLSASPNASSRGGATTPRTQPEGSVEGVVRVSKEADSEERRLVFRGVQIDRQGEKPLVVSYSADDLWRDFDGKRVWVRYNTYVPRGRSIGGEHAHVSELWVADESTANLYTGFGATKKMRGELREISGEKGSKSEGEKILVFVDAAGTSHQVLNQPLGDDGKPARSGSVMVVARSVELSRFAAHLGMPAVWVGAVDSP